MYVQVQRAAASRRLLLLAGFGRGPAPTAALASSFFPSRLTPAPRPRPRSACHNRFEHSLGVAHLARRLAYHIHSIQEAELGVTARDIRLVEMAGLCHDLGHGPFSHVFDREFLRRRGVTNWCGVEGWRRALGGEEEELGESEAELGDACPAWI